MRQRCENCGRPLLDSDFKCFHCDTPVPGREPPARPADEETMDLGAAARYGGVALALLVLGAILMNWMGAGFRSPLDATPTPAAPAGWREFISPQGDYRVWLPNSWSLSTPGGPRWEALLDQATHPLPNSFNTIEPKSSLDRVQLVGQGSAGEGERPPMMTIDFHPGLANSSLAALQVDNWSAGGIGVDTAGGISLMAQTSGELALIAELVYPAGKANRILHTVTMAVQSGGGVYAVSVSAERSDFLQQEEILWMILDSFRPLE